MIWVAEGYPPIEQNDFMIWHDVIYDRMRILAEWYLLSLQQDFDIPFV